ncbi:MAG TPA: hypothetical protein VHQ65_06235 [Thermoanaerobaculia bacterium]|nr:hypothetical protein [Thermoanaerobaculia bacterium]
MYKITDRPYGYEIAFQGFLQGSDIEAFGKEMEKKAVNHRGNFGVIVDLREGRTFPAEAQSKLMQVISFCAENGMNRNVLVADSAILKIQSNRLAKEGGVDAIRLVDPAQHADWRRVAEDWLIHGKEPGT